MRINRGTTCEKDKERGRRWKEEERRAGPCQSGSGSRVGGSERKERCGCMRGLGGAAGGVRRVLSGRASLELERSARVGRWVECPQHSNQAQEMEAQSLIAVFDLQHLQQAV